MHLVATNLALWVRTVIWESANEWIHHVYSQSIAQVGLAGDVIRVPDSPIAIGNRRSDDFLFRDRSIGDVGNFDYTDAASSPILGAFGGLNQQGCNGSLPISPDHIAQVSVTVLVMVMTIFIFIFVFIFIFIIICIFFFLFFFFCSAVQFRVSITILQFLFTTPPSSR